MSETNEQTPKLDLTEAEWNMVRSAMRYPNDNPLSRLVSKLATALNIDVDALGAGAGKLDDKINKTLGIGLE